MFYVTESGHKRKGASAFEKKLVGPGIKYIRAGVRHPPRPTAGLGRFHGEISRKIHPLLRR